MSTMFNRNRKGQQLGERHDGPNWVLIAGGAVVTVISFVIGRRESISKGVGLEKRKDNYRLPNPDSKKGIAYIATVGDKRIQTKYNGHQSDSYVDGTSTHLTSHFQIHRTKSCERDVPSSPKLFKETSMAPPCTDEDLHCSSPSPVSLQGVVSEKCDVVHKLQQQLKRRDGMIFDLQAQIIDQGYTVASHRAHIANLEAQLEEKSHILFDSTQEVQRLKRALTDQSVKCDACSKDCSGFDYREVVKSFNIEVETLAGEVKRLEVEKRELAEEVAHLECEKRERELVAQAMSQEHEKLVQRVFKMESELEEARKSALEKDHQFELNEGDQMEKTNSCYDQKPKLEAQVSESKQEMTRLADNFQTSDNIEDDVKEHMDTTMPMRLSSDKPNWAELSQHFSFSTGVTLPAQVKKLTQKLEQVAKQQQVEEEMAELKKHQTKIAELKCRVTKLTNKCQLPYTCTNEDKVRDQHTLQAAALVLELADRLAAQEEQERQTSVHKQKSSAEMTPHANGDANQSFSRYIAQDKRPTGSFDHPISFTFTEEVTRPTTDDAESHSVPSQLAEGPLNFPLATLGRPASKIQTWFSNGVKKSTSKKNHVGHGSGSEYLTPNWSSDSKKNSSPVEHVESNGFNTDTKTSDSGAMSVLMRKYFMQESKPSLGGKSHNMESDQKLGGHETRSMEDDISLLSLEIEQVMAETSSLPLLSCLHQDPRFLAIMKSLTVPIEIPMVAIDSRSSRASQFKQGIYIDDGEFLVDPPQSRGKQFTEDKEEGITDEDEISSGNYNQNPEQRIRTYPDLAMASPFSKMVASLDLKKSSSTSSLQASETFWEDTTNFPGNVSGGEVLDSHKACQISKPPKTASEEEPGSPGSSGSSIDSAFNEILEDTLEDLVKVCSVGTSLAGTPSSSAFSQGSVSKHVQQRY